MAETMLLDLWVLARMAGAAMDDALAPAGLAARQFVLYALLDRAGPVTPSELARTSGVPATTISKDVRRMNERGHLVELDNPADARSRLLQLSPLGVDVLGDAGESYAKLAGELAAALGEEETQIAWSLERLRMTLAEIAGRPGAAPPPVRPASATAHAVRYTGRRLSEKEEAQARQFVDFLRRDG